METQAPNPDSNPEIRKKPIGSKTTTRPKRKVVRKTVKRSNNSTRIFTTSELKTVLKDVTNPINIAEELTGINIVDELKGEKDKIISDSRTSCENPNHKFVKSYLDIHQEMSRDTFTGDSKKKDDEYERDILGMNLDPKQTQSARNVEINNRAF